MRNSTILDSIKIGDGHEYVRADQVQFVVFKLTNEIDKLQKVVDVARYVNQLAPETVYKLIEAVREFDK